jgi:methylmalonyl-CoA/ethylmalonyl-CoA epimerase
MRFHHLGIACENHDEVILFLENNFGNIVIGEAIFDTMQNATVQMITLPEGTKIELISGETVLPFVKRNTFLYHTCWSVNNISVSIEKLIKSGAKVISEPKEAILFDNAKVAFLASSIGIIELVEDLK